MKSIVTLPLLCLTAVLGCSVTGYRADKTDETATGTPHNEAKARVLGPARSDDSLIVQNILVGKLPPRTFVFKGAGFESHSIGTHTGGLFTTALGKAVEDGQVSDTDGDGRLSLREIKSFIDHDFYAEHVDESRLKESFSISSIPDVILLSKTPIPRTEMPRRKLVAVLVGVGKYQDRKFDLSGVDLDIETFTAMLNSEKILVSDSTIRVLQDDEATYDNVMEALDWLAATSTEEDLAVFYFSGAAGTVQGPSKDSVRAFFLALHDVQVVDKKPQRALETRVLLERLGEVRAAARVVFIDS